MFMNKLKIGIGKVNNVIKQSIIKNVELKCFKNLSKFQSPLYLLSNKIIKGSEINLQCGIKLHYYSFVRLFMDILHYLL